MDDLLDSKESVKESHKMPEPRQSPTVMHATSRMHLEIENYGSNHITNCKNPKT